MTLLMKHLFFAPALWCYCCLAFLSLTGAEDVQSTSTATEEPAAVELVSANAKAKPKVAFIHIKEDIDEWQARYIQRVIEDAVTNKADYIITHIDSFGGRVDSALTILDAYLQLSGPDKPKTIAFIDAKAISAAALIAYGHHEIYMTPPALIGDIGVIFVNAEGEMAYAPEKSVTLIRSKLANASSLRGWDAAWLQKMTDRNQKLFQIRHPDGRTVYLIEEQLPLYCADNEDIDRANPKQVIQILGEDRFVTQHADEAVKLNIATGVVKGLDDVFALIGTDQSSSMNLTPTQTESVARYLSTWAPLLLSLTILLIILEVKTAGVGIFTALACVTGALYFICQYYQDFASAYEIILIVVGLTLVAIELFTMVGGGLLAFVGAVIAFVGIFLSFMPDSGQFSFDSPFYQGYVNTAIINSLFAFFGIFTGIVALIYAAPKIPALQRMMMKAEIEGTSEGSKETQSFIGSAAVALTQLRPSGQIQLNTGLAHSANTQHGTFIDAGTKVTIVGQIYGDYIVVEATDEAEVKTTETL